MKKARVLFVSQEITPYLEVSEIGRIARQLPQGIQERGKEIRTFMPRFGVVNERRNQLHEVIRLSGMNLIIDDYRSSAHHQGSLHPERTYAGLFYRQRRIFSPQSRSSR
jgi:glycogen synthase